MQRFVQGGSQRRLQSVEAGREFFEAYETDGEEVSDWERDLGLLHDTRDEKQSR